jgi:hypothetical protein
MSLMEIDWNSFAIHKNRVLVAEPLVITRLE